MAARKRVRRGGGGGRMSSERHNSLLVIAITRTRKKCNERGIENQSMLNRFDLK